MRRYATAIAVAAISAAVAAQAPPPGPTFQSQVPPGDYVLTVEAASGERTAQRQVPLTIVP